MAGNGSGKGKKVKVDIKVEYFILKEREIFAAYCPALNLATQGDTYEKACKSFEEALQIFIDEVMEMGTLDEVLRENGWVRTDKRWVPPMVVGQSSKRVQIPA